MSTVTIYIDFRVGKTDIVPHPEKTSLFVMSSHAGWKRSPSLAILQVEPGHFKGSVELPVESRFRLMLTNTDPLDPGLAHRCGDIWLSLEEFPLDENGINNIARKEEVHVSN